MHGSEKSVRKTVTSSIVFLCSLLVMSTSVNATQNLVAESGSNSQPNSWPSFIYDNQNSRYNPGSGINISNVCNLGLAWVFSTGSASVTSQPIVSNGSVYFGDWAANAYSLNLSTGILNWKVHLHDNTQVSGTPAVAGGLVYFAILSDSTVYALNETNGRIVWDTAISSDPGLGIWSSPIVYDGRLFIGLAGLGDETNSSLRGQLDALNATSGAVIWRFITGMGTSGGAGTWGSVAVDNDSDTIYFGTGNPYGNTTSTLYSDSMIALNAASGKLIWYNQVHADDTHDKDFGATPNLFSYATGGVEYRAVGLASKDGNYYIFDRTNGALLSTTYLNGNYVHSIGNAGFVGTGANTEIFAPTYQENYAGVTAFFPRNQTDSWSAPQGSQVIGAIALSKGVVFFGDEAGDVEALSMKNGQGLFATRLPFGIWGGVTVASDYLLVPSYAAGGQLNSTNRSQLGVYAYSIRPNTHPCAYPSNTPGASTQARMTSASGSTIATSSGVGIVSTPTGGASAVSNQGSVSEYPLLIVALAVLVMAITASYVALRRPSKTDGPGQFGHVQHPSSHVVFRSGPCVQEG